MKYEIIWSAFSEQQIDDIFKYYEQTSKSYHVALKIITNILLAPDKLKDHSRIGQREDLLAHHYIEYYYIVESNYKIVYSIDEESHYIKIADVFDTRQNPEKINRKK